MRGDTDLVEHGEQLLLVAAHWSRAPVARAAGATTCAAATRLPQQPVEVETVGHERALLQAVHALQALHRLTRPTETCQTAAHYLLSPRFQRRNFIDSETMEIHTTFHSAIFFHSLKKTLR